MTLLLTPDELRDLTGTKQPKRQADWLKVRGWVFEAPTRRSNGTCSRHLCAKCATVTGLDTHLCPTHAAQGAPVQTSLEL